MEIGKWEFVRENLPGAKDCRTYGAWGSWAHGPALTRWANVWRAYGACGGVRLQSRDRQKMGR